MLPILSTDTDTDSQPHPPILSILALILSIPIHVMGIGPSLIAVLVGNVTLASGWVIGGLNLLSSIHKHKDQRMLPLGNCRWASVLPQFCHECLASKP